jgi:hypothetical protein
VPVRRTGDAFHTLSAREEEGMTTKTISRRTELAHRASDGIDVYLFWNELTNRISVRVLDARRDAGLEFEVDGRHALDAFNHPYAYAARTDTADLGALLDRLGADSGSHLQEPTINPWRTNHASTDR